MFSNHPSAPNYRPIDDPIRHWSLYVFSVAGSRAQQQILRSITHLQRDGVTALGTRRGSEYFVIVDYDTAGDRSQAKQVVLSIDPHATISFAGRKHQIRPEFS